VDLDLGFLCAVLRDKSAFVTARKAIFLGMLQGTAMTGWDFISDHVVEFGEVPSEKFFSAKTGIQLGEVDVSDGIDVLISELVNRSLWNTLKEAHETAGELLEQRKPQEALRGLQEAIRSSYSEGIGGNITGSLLALGPEVLAFYERMKSGERGILSSYQAINEMTLGWWPGDLVVFVARASIGKTFFLLMQARQAWLDGYKVLFVGTEMSRIKLALRFYAIHFKLPYKEFRRGQLSSIREEEIRKDILAMEKEPGLDVVGDDFDPEIAEIEAAVDASQPDILFVDGVYLVKNKGRDRHERVSNTIDDLKRLARRRGIPVVVTTQFNREVASNSRSGVSLGNIGITDVIAWSSDVVFAMYQTDDMKEDSMMGFRPLKLREGEGGDFFSIWFQVWQWEVMVEEMMVMMGLYTELKNG
jgi:replicative DNA helicase